jgi:hypothetical protein
MPEHIMVELAIILELLLLAEHWSMQKIAEAHLVGVKVGCGVNIVSHCINHHFKSRKEQKEMCGDFQYDSKRFPKNNPR